MKRKIFWRSIAIVVLLGVCLFQVQSARADGWAYWYGDNDVFLSSGNAWTPYFHARDVTDSPYGIAIYKDDGPEVQAATFNCSTPNTRSYSTTIPNSDPSGWIHVKPNTATYSPLHFCTTFKDNSSSDSDVFIGEMNWDGPQA